MDSRLFDMIHEAARDGEVGEHTGPEEGDFIIVDDTWRGISLHIVGGGFLRAFASIKAAAREAKVIMDREHFWSSLWVQYDRTDPQPFTD